MLIKTLMLVKKNLLVIGNQNRIKYAMENNDVGNYVVGVDTRKKYAVRGNRSYQVGGCHGGRYHK